ncbi:MAG: tail fiber protein [Phycisphaerae bacterium]|jgi:microcystin-dependent protein
MSEPFVGEIRIFAGNFAPRGWALCDGQLLAVSQNEALFSLLGTIYGGDGRTTFGLPDIRGRLPVHMGTGPGLSSRPIGQKGGEEKLTLTTNQLPSHTHTYQASRDVAADSTGTGNALGESPSITLYRAATPTVPMSANAVTKVGGSQNHTNLMPFQCVHFIIALLGIYPSRS